jgi:hypothetical protein
MKNWMRWIAPVAVLGLVLASPMVRAEDKAAGKGTISGKVVDADGKAVAGANVVLNKAPEKAQRQKKNAAEANPDAKNLLADDAAKAKGDKPAKAKVEPVAKVTTDAEGKFTLKDIAAGDYVLAANLKGVGNAKQKITVTDGKTADVSLALTPPKKAGEKPKKVK